VDTCVAQNNKIIQAGVAAYSRRYFMKYFTYGFAMVDNRFVSAVFTLSGWPDECDNKAPRVSAVKLAAPMFNSVDFSGSEGQFDPVPLLQTIIHVGGQNS
jgi:hypothetical protein